MKIRVLSSFFLLPLVLFLFYLGGKALLFVVNFVIITSILEFSKAFANIGIFINKKILIIISQLQLYLIITNNISMSYVTILILILLNSIFIVLEKTSIKSFIVTLFVHCYLTIPISLIYHLRQGYEMFFWTIFVTSMLTDTFAYFTGIFFGKNKLIPKLSPNKTIEGALGGIFFSIIGNIIYNYINPFQKMNLVFNSFFALFGSIFSQLGDLFASSIKRETGIKDFGNIIPGHGGIIDRIDSILFMTIYVYIVILFIEILKLDVFI